MHDESPAHDLVEVYGRFCDCCTARSAEMMFDELSAQHLCPDCSKRLRLRRALGLPSRKAHP